MPKFKAEIFPHVGGRSHAVYVESDDQWSAEALLKLQYPDCDVRWLQQVPAESSASSSGQYADTASETGSAQLGLREFLLLVLIAGAIQGYRWFKDTFFSPQQPVEVAADVAAVVEGPAGSRVEPHMESTTPTHGFMAAEAAALAVTDAPDEAALPPSPPAEPPKLRPFTVVVQTGAGAEAALTISARDEAHALQIVRDFRGNPPVVRVERP